MSDLLPGPDIPADAEMPYWTYKGADGADRRAILTTQLPVNFNLGFTTDVQIAATPLGADHDLNALARDVAAILHAHALRFGDVAVARTITLTMTETVRSLR